MKNSTVLAKVLIAGALLLAGACDRKLIVDEGGGNAGAAGDNGEAGEAGNAGTGSAGATGGAGSGEAGNAGTGAGTGEAGNAGTGAGTGEAGNAGAAGDGIGGSFGDQPAVTTHWSGNDASCPASLPEARSACALEEGQTCAYYFQESGSTQTSYQECACRAFCGESESGLSWDCARSAGSEHADLCPLEQPEEGSSCFGMKGEQCWYPPYVTCGCPTATDDSSWHCESERAPAPEHSDAVDEDKLVRDLSDEERAAWCAWYAVEPIVEPGFPEPPVREPTADGFYPDTGCAATLILGCATTSPGALPASACEDNLALSTCAATVGEMTDCVLTARNFLPSPNGCARYLDTPGCSGTLVNGGASNEPPTSAIGMGDECLVRVR